MMNPKEFFDPAATYRPWPFFVLNEEHEGVVGERRITELLEGFKRVGFGGAYIHPRPGLITEYLSPRWFELVRYSIRECRRLGLTPCLYDENCFPSGFGGGHTLANAPDTRARYIQPVFGHGKTVPPGAMSVRRWDGQAPGEAVSSDQLKKSDKWIAFVLRDFANMPFHAESSYVSLVDPMTSQTFIEQTHQRYREALSDEDWNALGSIFTDEPHLVGSGHGPWSEGLHCTPLILAAFRARYRYDVSDHLADLYFDTPKSASVRYDYYDLLHTLWADNWGKPLQSWCKKNKIVLTGHYIEHDWPVPYCTPGQMHLLAHQDWPGTDLLECFPLLGHDFGDPQNLDPAIPGQEPQALYYLKQTLSVANQFRKERVMDECWGAGGHDSTPADWSRIGRYLAVHGVNHFVPHHGFLTISGTRKQDHPQFFSDQSSWFEYLKPLNDELGRLAWAVTRGEPDNRILLLDALTTGYTRARKADALMELTTVSADDPFAIGKTLRSLDSLRKSAIQLAQEMSDRLLDFDIGDEYIIEESGSVRAGKLRIAKADYGILVWPPEMTNLRSATVTKLEEFLQSGGQLLGIKPTLLTVDGLPSKKLGEWERKYRGRISWSKDNAHLIGALEKNVPPRVSFAVAPSTGLALNYRKLSGGDELFLVVNSHPTEALAAVPNFVGRSKFLQLLNPITGELGSFEKNEALVIPPTEARIVFRSAKKPTGGKPRKPEGSECQRIRPDFLSAEPVGSNVLVLDICELEIGAKRFPKETVYRANERYWRENGIAANGWHMRVQMGSSLLKRDKFFSPNSGGIIRYEVTIGKTTPLEDIRLAMERPELWKVRVNGKPLSFAKSSKWRDPRIRAVNGRDHLRHGHNVIEVEGRPFQARQEIDVIYLLGNFEVAPAKTGFALAGPRKPLQLGSWRAQGLPFYDEAVDYHFQCPPGAGLGFIEIAENEWAGALVELRQGKRIERSYGPNVRFAIDPAISSQFTLRVVGLPKNLWGPWHIATKPRKRAWSNFWRCDGLTIDTPRSGQDYDLLDLGLLTALKK